jgi:4-hydroxybenzoate polyprenyltransferase
LEAFVKKVGIVSVILMLTSGCVVVGGYSSGRGWFLWPGTIVIFLVMALIFVLLRRQDEMAK